MPIPIQLNLFEEETFGDRQVSRFCSAVYRRHAYREYKEHPISNNLSKSLCLSHKSKIPLLPASSNIPRAISAGSSPPLPPCSKKYYNAYLRIVERRESCKPGVRAAWDSPRSRSCRPLQHHRASPSSLSLFVIHNFIKSLPYHLDRLGSAQYILAFRPA